MKLVNHLQKALAAIAALAGSSAAFAAGSGPALEFINFYAIILNALGVHDSHAVHDWIPVLGGLFTLSVLTGVGLVFKSSIERAGDEVRPEDRFSLRTFVEMVLDFVYGLAVDVIGKGQARSFFTLLASLFLFIFVSNLSGLAPGFPPATESLNTNLAMGFVVFFVYNLAGLKEHGPGYFKHFFGPVWWLAPLLFIIELISHLVRPLSLSLRLYGNIFGDHLVVSVFTGLTYLVVPAFLLFFGLLVASIQSFVFTLLSSIYISMAVSHDH